MKHDLYYKTKTDWGFIAEVVLLLALIATAAFFICRAVAAQRANDKAFRTTVREELALLRRDVDSNTRVVEELGVLLEGNTRELDKIDNVRRVLEQEMLRYVEEGVAPPDIFMELYMKTLKVQQPGE